VVTEKYWRSCATTWVLVTYSAFANSAGPLAPALRLSLQLPGDRNRKSYSPLKSPTSKLWYSWRTLLHVF